MARLKALYLEAVHERVAGVRSDTDLNLGSHLLLQALRSASADRALKAANILDQSNAIEAVHVKAMLVHSSQEVLARGVELAQAYSIATVGPELEQLIAHSGRQLGAEAVWALVSLNSKRAEAVLPPLLESRNVAMMVAAAGALASIVPGEELPNRVLIRLLQRGAAAPPFVRRELARMLGRLGASTRVDSGLASARLQALQDYLEDADASVRRLAIEATGKGEYVDLAPRLLRLLGWRDDRQEARNALATLGDVAVPLLAHALGDSSRTLGLRIQLPRILRMVGTQHALDALLDAPTSDQPALEFRTATAVARLHEMNPELTVRSQRVDAWFMRCGARWQSMLPARLDIRSALGDDALLSRLMGDRLDQAVSMSFSLLGMKSDPRVLRRAFAHATGGDRRRRAWALELLDNILPEDVRFAIAGLVEPPHYLRGPGNPDNLKKHVLALCETEDLLLRACSRRVARLRTWWPVEIREDDMNDQTLQRLFALESVEVFAQCDIDDLAAVAAVARECFFRSGERIYAEGDPGDALYVVVEGSVEARLNGETIIVTYARESFGETSLFDGAPRVHDMIARSDTRALSIDRRDFLDLVSERPDLLAGMFRFMSRQLKSTVVELAETRRAVTGETPQATRPGFPR